ncbi:MAG: response regulator [Verrucomicrobiae bacterium]|nr:response regulator [Verrucomicrobiae bacterium]
MNDSSKVLLVDDEESVLSACSRLLHKEAFSVVCTTSPEQAIELARSGDFAVVVSDHRMPAMEGTQLLARIREIAPDTVRLMLTGYADAKAAVDAINQGAVYRFLSKPWNDEELKTAVRQGVAQFGMVRENRRLQELTAKQNAELQELNQGLEQKVLERTEEIRRLNQNLEKSFFATIRVLAETSEIHSSLVGCHSKRVSALAKELGKRMNLPPRDMFELEIAGMLHDLGKMGVPSEILERPEAGLTGVQREIFRKHPVKGEQILRLVPGLGNVPLYIRHHHEKFDGSGYPDGLKGTDIPLISRIIAVADGYDKLLYARSTFDQATAEESLKQVQELCPSKYDGDAVAVLANYVHEEMQDVNKLLEVEVRIKDLQPGMIMARDVVTASGMLLIPKDKEIGERDVERIANFQETDPIVDSLFIYRRAVPEADEGGKVGDLF